MTNYEEIKKELVLRGVRLDGFAAWLWIRARSEKYDFIKYDLKQDYPFRQYGMFPYQRRWERVYPWLKSKVDIEDFANWLLGIPKSKSFFAELGEIFRCFGECLLHAGQMFFSKFRN